MLYHIVAWSAYFSAKLPYAGLESFPITVQRGLQGHIYRVVSHGSLSEQWHLRSRAVGLHYLLTAPQHSRYRIGLAFVLLG